MVGITYSTIACILPEKMKMKMKMKVIRGAPQLGTAVFMLE